MEASVKITFAPNIPENQFDDVVYQIEFPDYIAIADFLPKIQMGCELAGPIEEEIKKTGRAGVCLSADVQAGLPYFKIRAGGSYSASDEVVTVEQLRALPPKEVVSLLAL